MARHISIQILDKEIYGWRNTKIGLRIPYRKADTKEISEFLKTYGPKELAKIFGDNKAMERFNKKVWGWKWISFRI